jgi:hypothetical protein
LGDPPLAHVGLSERVAQKQGITVRVAKLPVGKVLRTEATGETQGFMTVRVSAVSSKDLGRLYTGTIVAAGGSTAESNTSEAAPPRARRLARVCLAARHTNHNDSFEEGRNWTD